MKTNANPQYDKQRLNSIDILEAASHLGLSLHRSGVNHLATCPWHEDTHPSLVLYHGTNKNHCHCYACGHHDNVIGLAMKMLETDFCSACEWLSAEFGIPTLDGNSFRRSFRPIVTKRVVAEKTPDYTYIPEEWVDNMVSTENALCRCLMQLFNPESVKWVTEEYRIGCYALGDIDDYTVFPCIDAEGRVRNLKIQHYDSCPSSPKFGHCDQTPYWLGKIWAKEGKLPHNAVFQSPCLFGEHLLSKYPTQKVVLVESPKNAVIGTLAVKDMLWVATGNKTAVKREQLMPLQGREVIVIPDRDAIDSWKTEFAALSDLAFFNVRPFSLHTGKAEDQHYDVADYIIEQRLETMSSDKEAL